MPGLIIQLQQRGFIGIVCECVCVCDLDCRQASQAHAHASSLVYTKNGQKILLAKLQQLMSGVPKQLQSVNKRKGDDTQW